ncbi:MAG: hypothetical protein KDK70_38035, partial [Myxococcales bacterium]|nr:hypothetical protein [Myxococcales bacterium]
MIGGVVATVLALALLAPALIGSTIDVVLAVLVLLVFFSVPTALVFVPGLLIWNAEGRKRFTAALWELLGELLTPIALPAARSDGPFRGHALPAAAPGPGEPAPGAGRS